MRGLRFEKILVLCAIAIGLGLAYCGGTPADEAVASGDQGATGLDAATTQSAPPEAATVVAPAAALPVPQTSPSYRWHQPAYQPPPAPQPIVPPCPGCPPPPGESMTTQLPAVAIP